MRWGHSFRSSTFRYFDFPFVPSESAPAFEQSFPIVSRECPTLGSAFPWFPCPTQACPHFTQFVTRSQIVKSVLSCIRTGAKHGTMTCSVPFFVATNSSALNEALVFRTSVVLKLCSFSAAAIQFGMLSYYTCTASENGGTGVVSG